MLEINAAIQLLCEEVGAGAASPRELPFELEAAPHTIRIEAMPDGRVILQIDLPCEVDCDRVALLQINGARIHAHGRQCVLAFDNKRQALLLWQSLHTARDSSHDVLKAAEALLNEADFWKPKLEGRLK